MALFRKFFYRKPPDGLLEISERVYVFDCCFTTDVLEDDEYKVYIGGIVGKLREQFPDASFMVFNFRKGENQSLIANILSEHDMTVMDYPQQYEGCPLLTMETIHHFLRSCESWLSLGQQNVLLMHCERGGWLVLGFMLAALLIYRKQYTGEQKTLDMIYKQAPRELLQLISPLNPMPSQQRYLQYITRRNVGSEWPPLDRALTLDCIIIRFIPNLDGEGGCRPIFRIYGPDPFMAADRTPKVLFSTPKKSKLVRHYKQADSELVKIDIHCHIQGDVVLECICLDHDLEREEMMFRIMFNTAFIRSNILMLNRDEIDILWNVKDQFPKDFRAEVLFSEMNAVDSLISVDFPGIEEKDGLPVEAFAKVQEIFSNVDWLDPKTDVARKVLQRIASSDAIKDSASVQTTEPALEQLQSENNTKSSIPLADGKHGSASAAETGKLLLESVPAKIESEPKESGNGMKIPTYVAFGEQSMSNFLDASLSRKKIEPQELQGARQRPAQSKIITQRSISTPVSYCSSSQGSPVPMSRYHSAPSSLGITALLHDHAASNIEEEIVHPVTVSAPYNSTSSPDLTLPKSVRPGQSSISTPQPPSPSPSSLQSSGHASLEKTFAVIPPSLPATVPQQTSNASHFLLTQHTETTLHGRGQSVIVSPPPPSFSGDSSCLSGKYIISSHPSAPPLTSLLHASLASSIKNLVSPPPPPPPPPFFPGTSSAKSLGSSPTLLRPPPPFPGTSSSVKHSVSAPPPPPPPPFSGRPSSSTSKTSSAPPTPPLPPCSASSPVYLTSSVMHMKQSAVTSGPPPPPPPPLRSGHSSTSSVTSPAPPPPSPPLRSWPSSTSSVPPPPPPPPRSGSSSTSSVTSSVPPPPPLPPRSGPSSTSSVTSSVPPPPPPPPLSGPSSTSSVTSSAPLPPPPPPHSGPSSTSTVTSSAPPPPPPPSFAPKETLSKKCGPVPPIPPPPLPNGVSKTDGASATSPSKESNGSVPSIPGPPSGVPFSAKARTNSRNQVQPKKAPLKPYHWLKLSRAMTGSLWAEAQKAPEFDMSELESLFSTATPNSDPGNSGGKSGRRTSGTKSEKVQLIELRRAYNCEIMLTKVKIPLPDLMCSVLALDESALDVDQVENLIKFCPTKEEMDLLKGYKGDKENLGKCEQFFLELMKVPRVEPKLRVFSFKIQFHSQVSDLRKNLNTVNSVADEIRNSEKLKRIMQTILSLGNALNHGTARGSAIGFRLDSLLKLTDTRARNNKLTLMHYLCKVLAEKLPELLDFPKDLVSLEVSTKIQLKYLAEEMQAISKGLEKVVQELTASENDGPVSETFCQTLKEFLGHAEAEVRSLATLYSNVGRNADALALYFGEDPARCPFEQVVSTLLNFVRMFMRAHEENCKQLEFERKKALKEAENAKKVGTLPKRESGRLMQSSIESANIK